MQKSADLNPPSIPRGPKPSITSLVNLKGMSSGVGRIFPLSNAIPKSMCTNSAVFKSTRILLRCLSPIPKII